MEIDKDEIKEVKVLGSLDGNEVKLVSLKGGFHIGMGRKSGKKDEILAAGSHPAIVAHQISKAHGTSFIQTLNKSEMEAMPAVAEYSHFLPENLYKNEGFDIYALKNHTDVEFKVTKHNFEICSIKAKDNGESLSIEKYVENKQIARQHSEELSQSLQKSIKDFANYLNLKVKNNLK